MLLEDIIRSRRLCETFRKGPLGPFVDGFTESISGIGYTHGSLRALVLGASQFARFLEERGFSDIGKLGDEQVDAFKATRPVYLDQGKYLRPITVGIRGARHTLRYLRSLGVTPPEPPRRVHRMFVVVEEWLTFLRQHRGLSPQTQSIYRRHACQFLVSFGNDGTVAGVSCLTVEHVRTYVQRNSVSLSRHGRKALMGAIRLFLGFLWDRGYTGQDLRVAIIRIPCFKHESIPRGPCWEQILRLPGTVDTSRPHGCRDVAILLILVTYGVRALQIRQLRLEQINWRAERIRFEAAKAGRKIDVPLTPAVGQAVHRYLREGRPPTNERILFVSTDPPFRPLTSASLHKIVSVAFRKVGIESPHRGSHSIRHAWATRMLARGQSLKVIADFLGHRRIETTSIYAKVDETRLREVALPWPGEALQ